MLLWQIILPQSVADISIIFYVNISVGFLLIALYSNLSRVIPQIDYIKLHPIFYQLAYSLYSSKTVLGFAIASVLNIGFGSALIIALILWFVSVKYLEHKLPFTS